MNKDLLRIITCGSALTWGGIVASLQALRAGPTSFTFHVSWVTALAFILGTGAVYLFWRVMLRGSGGERQRGLRIFAEVLLVLSGIAAFLYPLRFVPPAKLPEISIGLGSAVVALSIVGYLLFSIRRFLEADEPHDAP